MVHRAVRGLCLALVAVLALALFGFVVMQLWNWLLPALFGWKTIGFWQAAALLVLTRILFGGFGRRGHMHGRWRARMRERWEQMTPEEREKFRAGLRGRCGWRSDEEKSDVV
jgi:hypothetical protein